MVFNVAAVDPTASPVPWQTHTEGTVTICAPGNGGFACFPNGFEAFWETVCGSGKLFAVITRRPCRNTRISNGFCMFPEGCPAAPGACSFCRLHYCYAQPSLSHVGVPASQRRVRRVQWKCDLNTTILCIHNRFHIR